MGIQEKKERKWMAILKIIGSTELPISSLKIAEEMTSRKQDISERAVRIYLNEMEEEGLITSISKKGRILTEKGREEIQSNEIFSRVGFLSAKIDRMTYQMTFDLETRSGTVVVNTSIIRRKTLIRNMEPFLQVFEKGYAMGNMISLIKPGQNIQNQIIPEDSIGLCTVCSVTLNGLLLKKGVPVRSLFSGLLDLENGQAQKFSEIISYDGTSIDPLELFIRGRMTNYLGAIANGCGRIGAGFREVPSESYERVCQIAEKADRIGLGAFMRIGKPEQMLLNIPVREGCCGVIVIGGLNPLSIFEEMGETVQLKALASHREFNELFHYSEIQEELKKI